MRRKYTLREQIKITIQIAPNMRHFFNNEHSIFWHIEEGSSRETPDGVLADVLWNGETYTAKYQMWDAHFLHWEIIK